MKKIVCISNKRFKHLTRMLFHNRVQFLVGDNYVLMEFDDYFKYAKEIMELL